MGQAGQNEKVKEKWNRSYGTSANMQLGESEAGWKNISGGFFNLLNVLVKSVDKEGEKRCCFVEKAGKMSPKEGILFFLFLALVDFSWQWSEKKAGCARGASDAAKVNGPGLEPLTIA